MYYFIIVGYFIRWHNNSS